MLGIVLAFQIPYFIDCLYQPYEEVTAKNPFLAFEQWQVKWPIQGYKAKNGKAKSWGSISDVIVCTLLTTKAYYFHSVIEG